MPWGCSHCPLALLFVCAAVRGVVDYVAPNGLQLLPGWSISQHRRIITCVPLQSFAWPP